MMTKRKAATTTERTTTRTTLTSLEEKVIRMRRGLAAPDSLVLAHHGEDNPELWAKLEAMERRALGMAGASKNTTKNKIISALKSKKQ